MKHRPRTPIDVPYRSVFCRVGLHNECAGGACKCHCHRKNNSLKSIQAVGRGNRTPKKVEIDYDC